MVTQPDRAMRSNVLERDWAIDIVRVCSITVVVVVHWISIRVTVVDGVVRGDQALHGRPVWGTDLAAAGDADVLRCGWIRQHPDRRPIPCPRPNLRGLSRVAGAATDHPDDRADPFIVAVDVGLDAFSEPAAAAAADIVASPLWFLAVYLIAAMVAPFAVRAHDVSALLAPVVLLGCSFAVDVLRFGGVNRFAEWNLIFICLFCHQIGILYARGTLGPVGDGGVLLIAVAGIGVLIVMVVPGPYLRRCSGWPMVTAAQAERGLDGGQPSRPFGGS
ncbi:hypothetical protein [Nocardia sp. CA-120079]|uniref:hypothetical protein n=1 Tax=Nocardia sp. CA-120079 TaxID=3239974 RepID=UPI003D960C6A